jgi:hypothetical protein
VTNKVSQRNMLPLITAGGAATMARVADVAAALPSRGRRPLPRERCPTRSIVKRRLRWSLTTHDESLQKDTIGVSGVAAAGL